MRQQIYRARYLVIAAFLMGVSLFPAWAATPQACRDLAKQSFPNATVTLAELIPAGPFKLPNPSLGGQGSFNLPAFCRVAAVVRPTSDSAIKFELWMPAEGWNGKFEQFGNGGFAGVVQLGLIVGGLRQGFAAASTDDGHEGSAEPTWAIGHPEKVIDFGYRAVHLTAETSKRIIRAFYGRPAQVAYFNGCSDGGREALAEAQRYPEDFKGILAGAPANDWTHLLTSFVWNEQALLDNPASYLPESKLPAIQNAALAACDALDGVKDGVIEDPRRCHFDPAALQCKGADGSGCLTPPQVEAVKKLYAGPRDPRTGKQIFPGLEPGAEAAPVDWPAWITGKKPGGGIQFFFANGFFADMAFDNPQWNFRSFDFHKDTKFTDAKLGPILNSNNPDLRPFNARGGKLILYHGWADTAIAPRSSIDYYESVVAAMGKSGGLDRRQALEKTQDFFRFYLAPGMGHCGGGPGPNSFGTLLGSHAADATPQNSVFLALQQWVEKGVPPRRIIATKYRNNKPADGVERTRPLCVYPKEAAWTGKGGTDSAANFVCKVPSKPVHMELRPSRSKGKAPK